LTARIANFTKRFRRDRAALEIVRTAALTVATDPAERANIKTCDTFEHHGDGDFILANQASKWACVVTLKTLVRAIAAGAAQ